MSQVTDYDRIDQLLDMLEQEAEQNPSLLNFSQQVVDQLSSLTGAAGVELLAAVQTPAKSRPAAVAGDDRDQPTSADSPTNISDAPLTQWIRLVGQGVSSPADLGNWLSQTLEPSPLTARPDSATSPAGSEASATSAPKTTIRRQDGLAQFAVLLPGDDPSKPLGSLVLMVAEPCPRVADKGLSALLQGTGEILADYFRNSQRQAIAARESQLDQLIGELYAAETWPELAAGLAHDLPGLLSCQRVSVLRRQGKRARLDAVTGTDVLRQRTELVRAIESFVAEQQPTGSVLVQSVPGIAVDATSVGSGSTAGPDKQTGDTLLVPLYFAPRPRSQLSGEAAPSPRQPPAVYLMIQWADALAMSRGLSLLGRLLPHVSRATLLVGRRREKTLWGRLQPKGRWAGRLTSLALAAAVALVIAWLTVGRQSDFTIEAKGQLEPLDQRLVFASHDGYVDELLVSEGQQVERGQVLVRLNSPSLEIQLRQLEGDIAAARKRRDGLTVAISQLDASRGESVSTGQQLAAEVASLDERLKGLDQQRALVLAQQEQLVLRSPIDGTVVSWDAERNLQSRPVKRGDALLKIADISGPWRLRLWVPDREFGHLSSTAQPLLGRDVSFKLMSRPEREYAGELSSVGHTVQTPEGAGPAVAVDFQFDRSAIESPQVGATAVGRIDCGKRSWWYVWTRTLRESIQRRFWIWGEEGKTE